MTMAAAMATHPVSMQMKHASIYNDNHARFPGAPALLASSGQRTSKGNLSTAAAAINTKSVACNSVSRAKPAMEADEAECDAAISRLVSGFDSELPIEHAFTPPSSWYTNAKLLRCEMERVFWRGWQVAGLAADVEKPFHYFTGSLGRVHYVVSRDGQGELHAFHNLCRHHAAAVASGSGCKPCLVCPYHGWTYTLDGKFQSASQLSGIKDFEPSDNGLVPIRVAIWGPFVLINIAHPDPETTVDEALIGMEWLGDALPILAHADMGTLCHVARKDYIVNCNWKVFCDNYLDGGYHVPFAHKNLAKGLSLDSYSTKVFQKVSVQTCQTGDTSQRLGSAAFYAFVYPNFMLNRYGPWLDTNLVVPITTFQCRVVFDYFLDRSLLGDRDFIELSLCESEKVQMEDTQLCEGVQRGLESPAYIKGRYAPQVEVAMHHFHCLLQKDLLAR